MNDNNFQSGIVEKKGFLGIWSKRYLKLSGTQLIVYKDENFTKVDSTFEITPKCSIKILNEEKKPRFIIQTTNGNSVIFETLNYNDLMNWVLLLRSTTFFNPNLNINDFQILSILGEGYFGKVFLAKSVCCGELFAIKTVRKKKLINQNKIHTIIAERNILTKSNHPFIVSLKFAFQTKSKFYLGLEYISGGELFYYLQQKNKLNFKMIRIILAQIILAFNYLHSIGIIYRDLKPENILIDNLGYIKLTDFGLSKDIIVDDTTGTFCGTPDYMSPEIILHISYGKEVDWWALGILTYELFFGHTPFFNSNTSKLLNNIIEKNPKFPNDVDPIVKDFILKLLNKNKEERASYDLIINHKFFEGFNFENVLNKKIEKDLLLNISINNNINLDKQTEQDSFGSPVIGSAENIPGFSFMEFSSIDNIKINDSCLVTV